MKKITLLLILLTTCLYAQDNRHEKIKALKTAFITEKLELTPSEAEKFWPIYNNYDEKMHNLRKKERKEIYTKLKDGIDTMSDKEANSLIDRGVALQNKEMEHRNELITKLRNVIPPKKVLKLRKVEDDFKRQLLEQYRKRKGEKEE